MNSSFTILPQARMVAALTEAGFQRLPPFSISHFVLLAELSLSLMPKTF